MLAKFILSCAIMTSVETTKSGNEFGEIITTLVQFSKAVSLSMEDVQKNICQLLRIVNAQEQEILKLKKIVENLQSQHVSHAAQAGEAPREMTLENMLSDADSLRESDEYESLLEKMKERKNKIGQMPKESNSEKTQKELEVAHAKKIILEHVRQHTAGTSIYI